MVDEETRKRLQGILDRIKNPRSAKKGLQGPGGPKRTWKPEKDKENLIRLIKYPFSKDEFVQLFFHYAIGGKSILCLEKNFGKECPVCNFGRDLNGSESKEDKELGKKMFPKERYFSLMIDRNEENPFPKYFGFGVRIYEYLIKKLMDPDYENFLNPLCGLDAIVTISKEEGRTYAEPTLTFRRNDSRLAETDEQIKELVEKAVPIEEVFRPMNEIQIRKLLDDAFAFGDDEVVVKGNEEKKETNKESVELDEAFDRALAADKILEEI